MISLLVLLLVVGIGLYFFNTMVTTIDPRFKTLINGLVCLFVFLYILAAFGLVSLPALRVR